MTQVPATQSGGAVEQYTGYNDATGLEDMSATDSVIPRLKIVQDQGLWEDNLTKTPFKNLYFIAIGLVKQRVLFHPNVEDNDVPMCKSSDFENGYPNPKAPEQKSFPWAQSGFDWNDFPPIDAAGTQRVLPCSGCQLKEWGSHPTSDAPYCAEQWTLPIYFDASDQPAMNDETIAWDPMLAEWQPAILTLQKSSLKPIRSYLSSFKGSNKPPFLNICRGTLKTQQRGKVTYSIPTFIKGPESPRERWNEFAESFVEMRTYLRRPPFREDDDPMEGPSTDNSYSGPPPAQPQGQPPVQQQGPAQPQTVQQAPVAPAQDPWSAPAPQPAAADPWAAPATQPETPQPAAAQPPPAQPAPQPAQPVAPVQPEQPAAVAPPAQPQPVVETTPEPQAPAGQGLPF